MTLYKKLKKNGQPSMLIRNQHRWLSLSRAKIRAKARVKPKEGLGSCFSLLRTILARRISVDVDGYPQGYFSLDPL
jgi:hypothetical protein